MYNSLRFHGLEPTSLCCPWDFPGIREWAAVSMAMTQSKAVVMTLEMGKHNHLKLHILSDFFSSEQLCTWNICQAISSKISSFVPFVLTLSQQVIQILTYQNLSGKFSCQSLLWECELQPKHLFSPDIFEFHVWPFIAEYETLLLLKEFKHEEDEEG